MKPPTDSHIEQLKSELPPFYLCRRHWVTALTCAGVICLYLPRICLSSALVDLKNTYKWDEYAQGFVNSAFYFGSLLTHFLGGYSAQRFGGRPVAALSVLICSLSGIIGPITAPNIYLFICGRILMGMGQGLAYPSMIQVLKNWTPPTESSLALNVAWAGGQIGTLMVMGSYPIIRKATGLAFPFYLYGGLGLIWCLVWYLFITEAPKSHSSINKAELTYIEECQKAAKLAKQKAAQEKALTKPTTAVDAPPPTGLALARILFSPAAVALYITYFTFNWTGYLIVNNLPKILETILGYEKTVTGVLAGLPYLLFLVVTVSSAFYADHLTQKGVSPYLLSKVYVFIGFSIGTLCLFLIPFISNRHVICVLLFVIASVPSIAKSGFVPAVIHIAPDQSALITAICYFIVGLAGILCPTISGAILNAGECHKVKGGAAIDIAPNCIRAWNIIYFISGTFFMVGCVAWILFSEPRRRKETVTTPVVKA